MGQKFTDTCTNREIRSHYSINRKWDNAMDNKTTNCQKKKPQKKNNIENRNPIKNRGELMCTEHIPSQIWFSLLCRDNTSFTILLFLKLLFCWNSFFAWSFPLPNRNIILTRSLGDLTDFLIQYLYTGNSLHTMIHKTKQQRKQISKTEKLLTEVSLVQGAILKDWFMSGHCARFGCCCRVDFTLPIFNFSYISR